MFSYTLGLLVFWNWPLLARCLQFHLSVRACVRTYKHMFVFPEKNRLLHLCDFLYFRMVHYRNNTYRILFRSSFFSFFIIQTNCWFVNNLNKETDVYVVNTALKAQWKITRDSMGEKAFVCGCGWMLVVRASGSWCATTACDEDRCVLVYSYSHWIVAKNQRTLCDAHKCVQIKITANSNSSWQC